MKSNLENVFPKDNFYLTIFYAVCMLMILFGLTWYEMIITLVIDTLVYFCIRRPEQFIFYKMYPKYLPLRAFAESARAVNHSFEGQNTLFRLLSHFPLDRGLYSFFGSLLKVLPAGLYICYISEIPYSFSEKLLMFYLAEVFIIIYSSGLLFIELHNIASGLMSDLRAQEGWNESYRQLRLSGQRDRFFFTQNFLLVAMLLNLLLIVIYLASSFGLSSNHKFFILFGAAILCIGVLQLRFQQYFTKTLTGMFEVFNKNLSTENLEILPMHTSPMLSGFEYAFNQLGSKLEQREKEISQWLKHESDQFHLRTLGEITGLVAHDMKTPLHVMQMSLDFLKDPEASEATKNKYLMILDKNLAQTISFSDTLMAYLRGSKESTHCHFGEVHHHLIELFRTQFFTDNFEKIRFELSEELSQIELKVSRLNAMHVFYNLYQNALKSILLNNTLDPSLSLWSESTGDEGSVFIYIQDNGSGLNVEEFQNIISFSRFKSQTHFGNGLGLRLTHKLLSHLEGSLDIMPIESGTCLRIKMPRVEERLRAAQPSAVTHS